MKKTLIILVIILISATFLFCHIENTCIAKEVGKIVYAPLKIDFDPSDNYREVKNQYKGVFIINLDGTEKKQLASESPAVIEAKLFKAQAHNPDCATGFVRFSPDGQWVTFVKEGNLWIIRPDGSEKRKLASMAYNKNGIYEWEYYIWSPDSKKIAVTQEGSLCIVFPDGSGTKKIKDNIGQSYTSFSCSYPFSYFCFSNDSTMIAYYYRGKLEVKNILNNVIKGVCDLKFSGEINITDMHFLAGDRKVALQTYCNSNGDEIKIYMLELSDAELDMKSSMIFTGVQDISMTHSFDVSPTEEKFVINSGSDLLLMSSNGSSKKLIEDSFGFFSIDGKNIASSENLYIITPDEKYKTQVVDINIGFPINLWPGQYSSQVKNLIDWSSDCSKIAFADWWGAVMMSGRSEEGSGPIRINKIYISKIDGSASHQVPLGNNVQVISYDLYW